MVDSFNAQNDRFYVVNNDRISFDTARPSVELFPDNTRIIWSPATINFPTFIQGQAYYRNQSSGITTCESWATFIWQEWGPDEAYHNERYLPAAPQNSIPGPTTRNLPRTYIGSVPAETTYIDVRMNLTRTNNPPLFYGLDEVSVPFQQGQWTNLPGGSCTCEIYGVYASRHFNIRRIGNDIYLERYMSVRNANSTATPAGGTNANVSVNQSGWNVLYNNTESINGVQMNPLSNLYLNYIMQRKPYDTNGNKRPGGTNPCAQNAWQDTSSNFTGTIIITPGRYRT